MKASKVILLAAIILCFSNLISGQAVWQKVTSINDPYLRMVKYGSNQYFASSGNCGVPGGPSVNSLYHSSDLITWTPSPVSFPSAVGLGFNIDNNNTLFLATQHSGIYKSSNAGVSWSYANIGNGFGNMALDIEKDTINTLYAGLGGSLSGLHISTNNGTTWTHKISTGADITAIEVVNKLNKVYAVNEDYQIWSSSDHGNTWSLMTGLPFSNNAAMVRHIDTTVFIFTKNGSIYKSINSASSWIYYSSVPVTGTTNPYMNDAIFLPNGIWWVGYALTGVWMSADSGFTFNKSDTGLVGEFSDFLYDNNVLLASTTTGIYRYIGCGIVNEWDTVIICEGDTYKLPGGQFVSQPGNYIDTISGLYGCDSIITTTLMVNLNYSATISAILCPGDTYFLPGNIPVTTSGTYTSMLSTSNGCDSVITTNLQIAQSYFQAQSVSICQGDSFLLPSGLYTITQGLYIDTFQSIWGCDSIWTTQLIVNQNYLNSQIVQLCPGESYTLPGGVIVNFSGFYTISLSTMSGCDSILIFNVIQKPSFNQLQNVSICQGDSFLLPSGVHTSTSGIYTDSFLTINGCDSIWTSNLIVNQSYLTSSTISLCPGDAYMLPNGIPISISGQYFITLQTQSGCDSSFNITIINNPTFNSTQSVSICQGSSFLLPGGLLVSTAGTYVDTFLTIHGCDSIWTSFVNINPSFSSNLNASICQGDYYILPSGLSTSSPGIYIDTLQTILGCDSIVLVNLTVHPNYNSTQNVLICSGESYMLPNGNLISTAGTYTDTLNTQNGCDSIWVINASIIQVDTSVNQIGFSLFANASQATFQWLDCNNGFAKINGATASLFVPSTNGNYAVLITQNGCTDTSACFLLAEGLSDVEREGVSIGFFPNPANDMIEIIGQIKSTTAKYSIHILSISGMTVFEESKEVDGNEISCKVDISRLPAGEYIIQCRVGQSVQSAMLIKI